MNNYYNRNDDSDNVNNNFTDGPDRTAQIPIIISDQQQNSGQPEYNRKMKKIKHKKGLTRSFVAAAVAVCIILSGAAGFGGTYLAREYFEDSKPDSSVENKDTPAGNEGGVIYKSVVSAENSAVTSENAIAAVAAKAADTVVEITTETMQTSPFWQQYIQSGAGSGVIITENGYIITCAHVIAGASNIKVKMTDGMEYTATVIGTDSLTDIAVIKIDKTGLPFAVIGDSDTLVVGQDAIAIGNPLGELGGTVTNGIISALDRQVEIDNHTYNLLQTNAAINPGNSGGGLFNIKAELIGVVNAKSSGSGIEGLGFAIPINDAIKVADQLINFGYIKGRPQLGIMIKEVTGDTDIWQLRSSEYAALLNYITEYGVYFLEYRTDIQKEGDLKFGDRIIAIDGIEVKSASALANILNNEYKVGDTVKLTVSRLKDLKTRRSEMIDIKIKLIESVPDKSADDNTKPGQ